MTAILEPETTGDPEVSFLWLEITGKCQLECVHCYADSSPTGNHGTMRVADWKRVIDQAASASVRMVQFIGGEPTLHPDLPDLIIHALNKDLAVEVYTNLVHVTEELWAVFRRPGVSLATSYYSDDPEQHQAITGRPTHARTTANIATAARRGIRVRAGVVDVGGEQRADQAHDDLVRLGVPSISRDRLRQVGRGIRDASQSVKQLCGQCGQGSAAVGPDGSVWPCVFSRWLPVGNVREQALRDILTSAEADRVRTELRAEFDQRPPVAPCVPNMCDPHCGPSCSPACRPAGNCRPVGACSPDYG